MAQAGEATAGGLEERLAAAAEEYREAFDQATAVKERRDAIIILATDEGWGPRRIARATGLSPSRVQRILGGL